MWEPVATTVFGHKRRSLKSLSTYWYPHINPLHPAKSSHDPIARATNQIPAGSKQDFPVGTTTGRGHPDAARFARGIDTARP